MVGFREPGYLYRLAHARSVPFVLGPVGGTQNYPEAYLWRLGRRPGAVEVIRTRLNRFQLRHGRRFRDAAQTAALVLAANSEGQRDLRAVGIDADLLLETGIRSIGEAKRWQDRRPGPLRILWVGETIFRKAVDLVLDAVERLRADGQEAELTILGAGPFSDLIPDAPHIRAPGWVPREAALAAYGDADVFVFSSLRDTSGNVVLEALASGLPVVYLDHQGVHDMASDACGVPIAVSDPEQSGQDIAAALRRLGETPALYDRLSRGAIERAHQFAWHRNGDRMNAAYERLLRERRGERCAGEPLAQKLPLATRPAPWL